MKLDISTLTAIIAQTLPLQDWGFIESAKTDSFIIYDSEWCRIKFHIDTQISNNLLRVYYGRLHALDDTWSMKWNNEDCYCWYGYYELQLALKFLDGLSPHEAFQKGVIPPVLAPVQMFQDYYDSEFAKSTNNTEARLLKLHHIIWKHYQVHFFELFDLRSPILWEKYVAFLKEFYRLRGSSISSYNPKYC